MTLKLGMIGYGAIGKHVEAALGTGGIENLELVAALVKRPRTDGHLTHEPERFFANRFDAVAECAGHEAVRAYGQRVLEEEDGRQDRQGREQHAERRGLVRAEDPVHARGRTVEQRLALLARALGRRARVLLVAHDLDPAVRLDRLEGGLGGVVDNRQLPPVGAVEVDQHVLGHLVALLQALRNRAGGLADQQFLEAREGRAVQDRALVVAREIDVLDRPGQRRHRPDAHRHRMLVLGKHPQQKRLAERHQRAPANPLPDAERHEHGEARRGAAEEGEDAEAEHPAREIVVAWRAGSNRRAEGRLRLAATVFASTQDGIVVCEPDGTIIAVNPAFTAITGYEEADVLGHNMRPLGEST